MMRTFADHVVLAVGMLFTGTAFTLQTHAQGGVPVWTNRYTAPGGASAQAITVDSNGNVFVTGASTHSNGDSDYATIKYSNAGVPLWTRLYNGPGSTYSGTNASPKAIAVDKDGNVFVTGSTDGSDGFSKYATIKYSNAGVPLWTNLFGQYGNYTASAIAVDSNGNVFVTGDNGAYATVAYSNAGLPLWTNGFYGNGTSSAYAIAVDSSGDVCVTGNSQVTLGGNNSWVTIKYSSSTPASAYLDVQTLNSQVVLSWTNVGFHLQAAPQAAGTYTNIPSATSPYTNNLSGPQQFFRLSSN